MYAAIFGVFGVLLGVILTHLFAISNEWRNRRMEAMVATVVASIRVLGAHEQMYRLFQGGYAPSLADDRAVRALTERGEAFTEWRIARARLEIVVPDDKDLEEAVEKFNQIYAKAESSWVSTYVKEGEDFRFEDFAGVENEIWKEMRRARHDIIDQCNVRSRQDARWRERIQLALSNRLGMHRTDITCVLAPILMIAIGVCLARSEGLVPSAAEKRRINQMRVWPNPQEEARPWS
jgi:hypothetical protein